MREFLHSFSRLELDKVKQRIQNYTLSPLGREHVENLAPSVDLEEVRHKLAGVTDKKHALWRDLESILKSSAEKEWAQEEIITTRDGRMVIPVKSEHRNRIPGFIHSSSSSGATVFVEPTVTLELNNEIRTLEFEERREVEKILMELTDQVRASTELLRL